MFNFEDFAEANHQAFSDTELKAVIMHKIFEKGGPCYPNLTSYIIDQVYAQFKTYGNTIEYFVKAHYLIERHLKEKYTPRADQTIVSNLT